MEILPEPTFANVRAWLAAKPADEEVVEKGGNGTYNCLLANFLSAHGYIEAEAGFNTFSYSDPAIPETIRYKNFAEPEMSLLIEQVCAYVDKAPLTAELALEILADVEDLNAACPDR